MTSKIKANPDYSKSALNLTNRPEVEGFLQELKQAQVELSEAQRRAEAAIPEELRAFVACCQGGVEWLTKLIQERVTALGGYQDVEKGQYALQQVRQSWEWKPEALRREYPKFAALLIEEVVNTKAAEAQVKAGLLDEQKLKDQGVIVAGKSSLAWIIKTGQEA